MPRPKKNTDFLVGPLGILSPIVFDFLKSEGIPISWGSSESDRIKAVFFMSNVAAKPGDIGRPDLGTPLVDFDPDLKPAYFFELFITEPDFALRLMSYVRKELKVGFQNRASELATAVAFLREGAMTRFRSKNKGREPSDGELSQMAAKEKNVEIKPETFGDARRAATLDDDKTSDLRQRLNGLPSSA